VRKIRHTGQQSFEHPDALGNLVLRKHGGAQEPEAIRLSGKLCFERAQAALGGGGAAGAQRRVRLPEAFFEDCGFWSGGNAELISSAGMRVN
jgi:hypothetical protein